MSIRTIIARNRDSFRIDSRVRRSIHRCVSPLIGLIRSLRLVNYDKSNPSLVSVIPELTEIHRKAGLSRPDYHVGGFGFTPEEAVVRAIGESLERASHFQFHVYRSHDIVFHSQNELISLGKACLPINEYGHFAPYQFAKKNCPVVKIDEDVKISWLPTIDVRSGQTTYVAAQEMLAGFPCRNEPRSFVGITTGSAAHVDYERALLGALLELLQVDVTVGHWYSHSTASRIDVNPKSTPRFSKFWKEYEDYLERSGTWYEFFWLPQPENIPVYIVACVIRNKEQFPALMIGHGVALDIERAMYRALYEAIPISLVVQIQVLRQMFGDPGSIAGAPRKREFANVLELFSKLDINKVTDLEAAVAYYAIPENAAQLFPSRFDSDSLVRVDDIYAQVAPIYKDVDASTVYNDLLADTMQHHRLYAMDLTTEDIASMGIKVARLYSPDLMSLPLPSYPEADHPRFGVYGGFASDRPHPYP